MYLKYKGKLYDVGTRARINTARYGERIMTLKEGGVTGLQFDCDCYAFPVRCGMDNIIIEIVEPVEVKMPEPPPTNNAPPEWDVEEGWVWYIIVMAFGEMFNDRLLIWICATVFFFLWKNGIIGGKK